MVRQRGVCTLVLLLVLIPALASAQAPPSDVPGVAHRLAMLEATVVDLQKIVAAQEEAMRSMGSQIATLQKAEVMKLSRYLRVSTDRELNLPLIQFRGVNLQLVSGVAGAGGCWSYDLPTNGLGNLIIGYNEPRGDDCGLPPAVRTGSHNLVIGSAHSYSGQGGFVAGQANTIASTGTSVCGGLGNTADWLWASVAGGQGNKASVNFSSVSGGIGNTIDPAGYASWIGGGAGNTAKAAFSSIVGGQSNTTNGYGAMVSAGWLNSADNTFSWVGGGFQNKAAGEFSSVTGGNGNVANGAYEVVP